MDDSLAALTKAKQVRKQVEALNAASIPFRMVSGRPVVLESDISPVTKSETRPKVRKLG